ncbi:hypothetical protein HRbin01_01512 [archaeon HR01]|nr:hypothetical protein HRbin01_01512 [archaeon HR01]
MGRLTASALAAMLVLLGFQIAVGQGQTLQVHVITPDGVGRQGITVTVALGTLTARAVTNATGWATFADLQPGQHIVTAYISDIALNTTTVDIPSVSSLVLVVQLGKLDVAVRDLGGRPVGNIPVTLTSANNMISTTVRTNASGVATFPNIPYSSLSSIGGPYKIRVVKEGITVASSEAILEEPSSTHTVEAKLFNLNITARDRAGNILKGQASIHLKAGNFSQQAAIQEGIAAFTGLISSELVGEYMVWTTLRIERVDVTVQNTTISLSRDLSLEFSVDVGNVVAKVLDSNGEPLPNIVLVISSARLGDFVGGRTDSSGQLRLETIPLSTTVGGVYNITAYRGRSVVASQPLNLVSGETSIELVIPLKSVRVNVVDSRGEPLSGVEVSIKDPLTGRSSTGLTDSGGSVGLTAFSGPNTLSATYRGLVVYNQTRSVGDEQINLRLLSVNFPITVRVLDGLGRYAAGLKAVVEIDNKRVFDGALPAGPLVINSELPADVRVDVLSDGLLLARKTAHLSEESVFEIRFSDYILLGQTLIPMEFFLAGVVAVLTGIVWVVVKPWRLRQP